MWPNNRLAPPARSGVALASLALAIIAAAWANAAGVCWPLFVGMEHGEPVWWLQCAALATLLHALHNSRTWRQAAAWGLLFATAWLCATFWWLYISMHTYAGLNAVLTALAILALAAALALYYAIGCALYWRLRPANPLLASFLFAAVWTMAEMARGTWLTGFGWGAIGYAHTNGPLAAYLPWLGAYGVSALAAWVSAAFALGFSGAWVLPLGAIALLVAGMLPPLSTQTWSTPAGSLSVTLLQGNIPQDEKFETGSGVPQALQWYGEKLAASTTDLVVAPETAIPLLPDDLPDNYWNHLTQRFIGGQQAALIGIPLGNQTEGYTNSVLGVAPQQAQAWRYDKHHLVPFGEFIPPLFKWFTRLMNIPLGDFNRGQLGQASFAWKGQRLALNICYEDLFGEELGVRFRDAAQAPTAFVNVSNIGWFGDSVAIDQHLQISRMRALEFERPMLRATNTGMTVIIDYRGQVVQSLPRLTKDVLVGSVEGRNGLTPFARWIARLGLWPLWILGLAIVFIAARASPTKAH